MKNCQSSSADIFVKRINTKRTNPYRKPNQVILEYAVKNFNFNKPKES